MSTLEMQIADINLLEEIKAGNRRAFEIFYKDYHPRLYATIYFLCDDEALAEDLVQEAFLKLWLNRDKLRSSQSLTGYIKTIGRNLFLDYQRRSMVRESYVRQQAEPIEWEVSDKVTYDELTSLVFTSISVFSDDKQDMFIRSRLGGESYQEIALAKNTTVKAVERHIAKISDSLKKYLRKHDYLILFVLFTHIYL